MILMKYKPRLKEQDELREGDVRRFTLDKDGIVSYIGVLTRIEEGRILVMQCYKDDPKSTRYLIKDVEETGLEYSMFLDGIEWILDRKTAGRRYGKLSKRDFRNIRDMRTWSTENVRRIE